MAKRLTSLKMHVKSKHSPKTKKRLAIKKARVAARVAKSKIFLRKKDTVKKAK
ncbi:MAG: hypothetical protein WCF94_04405 [bacterium]|jgi:hypothetical protein